MKTVTLDPLAEVSTALSLDLLGRIVTVADLPTAMAATPSGAAAATAAAGPVLAGTADKVFRPNGEEYLPRKVTIGGAVTDDVAFVQKAYAERLPILLYGDPGTGKTALIEAALTKPATEGDEAQLVVTVQGTVETEVADFVGSWTQQTDGTYLWVDGPLVRAMEAGRPLLIDEIALIDSRVMAVVYGPMDGRDELVVTANPERGVVKAKDGFVVYGACNPNVPGAVMSDALLSRFPMSIEMTTDWSIAGKLGVSKQIITVARNLNIKKDSGELLAAPQLRELIAFNRVQTAFGLDLAVANFLGSVRPEDRSIASAAITSVFGREFKALTI